MSLDLLLEAAKYVEYRTRTQARGEEPLPYQTYNKLSADKKDDVIVQPEVYTPKRQQTTSSSSHSSEEIKEKKRSISHIRDTPLNHEHSGTGTREVHNKLEKNRRAHLKECFESLKSYLPIMDDRKTSNLSILRGAIRFIQILKRKEREYEHDMERLAREKIAFQQRLSTLKKELSAQLDHIDAKNFIAPHEDDNETTTTASECGNLSDFDDSPEPPPKKLDTTHKYTNSGTHVSSTVVSAPHSTSQTVPPNSIAHSKVAASGSQVFTPGKDGNISNKYINDGRSVVEVVESKPSVLASPASDSDNSLVQCNRIFPNNNLHTMTGIFTAPHTMQVITQPSGIKVITTPNSIMASNNAVQHISVNQPQHSQIHVLASSAAASYSTSKQQFSSNTMVQTTTKSMPKSHLVSPLALVSPQGMVELSHGKSGTNLSDIIVSSGINNSINSVKGGSVLSGNMAIAVKNNLQNNSAPSASQSNMIATLHVSKPHSQMIQPSLASGIITQGSQINNGTHHGVAAGLKQINSNPVRSLPHIAGIAHLVTQSPLTTPVGQLVSPGNHVSAVTPLVSVVSHTGAVHQQSIGKVLASPVLKSVNHIPIIQQQYLQQVSMGAANQPIVKPVVVVSMPNVVPAGSLSSINTPAGVLRGSIAPK